MRARLNKGRSFLRDLKTRRDFQFIRSANEDDVYFRHKLSDGKKFIIRIRRAGKHALLTFKAAGEGADTAWEDIDLPLKKPNTLESLLLSGDFSKFLQIKKRRWIFKHGDFEVNVDNVEKLGWFVEVEGRGSRAERDFVETKIIKLLRDLGIKEEAIIREGYVPLMLANGF